LVGKRPIEYEMAMNGHFASETEIAAASNDDRSSQSQGSRRKRHQQRPGLAGLLSENRDDFSAVATISPRFAEVAQRAGRDHSYIWGGSPAEYG